MKLITIGSSKNCKVFIPNDYVSSYHAELLLLDNGEIFLTDCGSKNGTFVQGKRIEPNIEVPVRRGDRIEFDDVPLNWSVVPSIQLPDPATVKGVYGVGKSVRNKYRLNGDSVSRYHATIKEMKNGKWYIQDHSKNGTFINGQRIPSDQDVRIKASDTIICGSVACPNPIHSSGLSKILLPILGGIAAVAAIVVLIIKFVSISPSIESLENATVWVYGEYYIDVTFEDDPLKNSSLWPSVFHFGYNDDMELRCVEIEDDGNVWPIQYQATAFFISEFGDLGTNRHVSKPWEYTIPEYEAYIRQTMQRYVNDDALINILRALSEEDGDIKAFVDRLSKSALNINGHHTYLGIGYTGTQVFSTDDKIDKRNLSSCQVIASSADTKQDVALLRLNTQETPARILDKGIFNLNKAQIDYSKLHSQDEVITIGYPGGIGIGGTRFREKSTELKPTTRKSFISKTPNADIFDIQMDVISGGSGSPVMDKRRRLIGVAFGSFNGGEIGYVCNIKYLKNLFEEHKAR